MLDARQSVDILLLLPARSIRTLCDFNDTLVALKRICEKVYRAEVTYPSRKHATILSSYNT